MKILLGSDPEVFMFKDGKAVSAHGMVKGDKKNPQPVRSGAVQVDGMALEFNTDPAATEEEFLFNVSDVLSQLKAMVPEYQVVATPVAHFGAEYIAAQPEEAKILGCDPDFNAWTKQENNPPNAELPFRTGAGHLHLGWTKDAKPSDPQHVTMAQELVKQLDFFLGLPSLIFDSDKMRREMYGKAGAYRPKSYGVEYRTLSNKWLTNESIMKLVYRNAHAAVQSLLTGKAMHKEYGDIQSIINQSDVKKAKAIMKKEQICYEV